MPGAVVGFRKFLNTDDEVPAMADKSPDRRLLEKTAAARPGAAKPAHAQKVGSAHTLGAMLEDAGLVSRDMLRDLIPPDESAAALRRALVTQQFVRDDDILDMFSQNLGYEKVNLKSVQVTPELLGQITTDQAIRYKVFPVAFDDFSITVALSDPLNIQTTDDLERMTRKRIIPVVANDQEIQRFIKHFYEGSDIQQFYDQAVDAAVEEERRPDEDYFDIDIGGDDAIEAPPVVKFVDLIFKQSVHDRASDIHIEPNKTGMGIRFRIDGVLHEYPSPPKKWQNSVLSRLKVLSGMDLAEKRIPQDGRIKLNIPGKKLDVRVSSIPSIYGESIVMRLLDQSSVVRGLEDVGFLPDSINRFVQLIRSPNGVICMTGPTGSGKTTTLYSALSTINNVDTKIVTIEDPVEYMLDGINQVQINKEVGLDFSLGLRSILRQSPDVIMVGEMRDLETAEIGIRAALTGHLVFSTLHTNDAPSACIRLTDMGVKPFMVASALQAVIAQRLVRRICGACKQEVPADRDEIEAMGFDWNEWCDTTFFKGQGCERCGQSGYRGRTAIHEIFTMNPPLRQMVIRMESGAKLKKAALKYGMRSLRQDGWEKVQLGQTTAPEILRITVEDSSH
jgi:type II secretory ATPase GspE/PulE/Tfp pilus assembly ATPase PilB-like protein